MSWESIVTKEWEKQAEAGDGQFAIACAIMHVARALDRLGTADAATPMGAIEFLAVEVKGVATAMEDMASQFAKISDHFDVLTQIADGFGDKGGIK